MYIHSFARRVLALVLTAAIAAAAALPGFAVYAMPIQTAYPQESIYLFDADTGEVLVEQNPDLPRCVASLTKMMTALLVLESGTDLNASITIPASLTPELQSIRANRGHTIGLQAGETVRRIDLMYAMLLPSANDAASVLAVDTSGSLAAFAAQMNVRASQLGCTATHFTCPHGLYDGGNYSTARDMAKIALACYADPTYRQIADTMSYKLPATNVHPARTVTTTNKLLQPGGGYYRSYAHGMKTGFTTQAGRCFVTFAQQDGHTYGLVVLGSDMDNIYRECAEILDWAFSSFSDRQLVDTETVLTTIPLTKCRSEEAVELYAAEPLSGYGHADDKEFCSFELPESVSATVKNGAVLGEATVYLDGYEVGKVSLVTHQEYVSDFRTDLKSTLLLMAALVLILAVLSFVTMVASGGSLNLNRKHRTRRR